MTGSTTSTWTLKVGGAKLANGVINNEPVNGTNYSGVTNADDPQVPTTGKTFGVGPRIVAAYLSTEATAVGAVDTAWNKVGDVLTIQWSEAATRTGGNGSLTAAEVGNVLGTTVGYAATPGTTTVTLGGRVAPHGRSPSGRSPGSTISPTA